MSKTLAGIWIHAVWATKYREQLLNKEIRPALNRQMKKIGENNNFFVDIANGMEDHMHCLFMLPTTLTVSETLKILKGNSSTWLLKNPDFDYTDFQWQRGYAVFSVSPDNVSSVRGYIYHQEQHHKTFNYQHELHTFKERAEQSSLIRK